MAKQSTLSVVAAAQISEVADLIEAVDGALTDVPLDRLPDHSPHLELASMALSDALAALQALAVALSVS